jgi:hypothetical protein
MKDWTMRADEVSLARTAAALAANGFEIHRVHTGSDARTKVLELVPPGAEVLTMTSVTLDTIGVGEELNGSGRYESLRTAFGRMDPKVQARQMRKLGAGPDVTVGSVHALTESGAALVASFTGSQLPAYAYGAGSVVWVVGSQKIVKDLDEAMERLQAYLLDVESERARKAYGLGPEFRTFPSKILLFQRELQPGRVKIVLVDEAVGH